MGIRINEPNEEVSRMNQVSFQSRNCIMAMYSNAKRCPEEGYRRLPGGVGGRRLMKAEDDHDTRILVLTERNSRISWLSGEGSELETNLQINSVSHNYKITKLPKKRV